MSLMREPGPAKRKSQTENALAQIVVICQDNADLSEIQTIASRRLQCTCCASQVSEANPESSNSFHLRGSHWFIQYQGCREFSVPNSLGMRYIVSLLYRPRMAVAAFHLKLLDDCINSDSSYSSSSPLCDQEALADYRQRLLEISEEIRLAELNHDLAQLSQLKEEHRVILAETIRVVGWSGQIRESGENDRARMSVQRAIKRARDNIRKASPQLGRHLDQIKTGLQIVYEPDPEIIWEISTPISNCYI